MRLNLGQLVSNREPFQGELHRCQRASTRRLYQKRAAQPLNRQDIMSDSPLPPLLPAPCSLLCYFRVSAFEHSRSRARASYPSCVTVYSAPARVAVFSFSVFLLTSDLCSLPFALCSLLLAPCFQVFCPNGSGTSAAANPLWRSPGRQVGNGIPRVDGNCHRQDKR